MPTLYRKYRPQTFAEVAGQEPIKVTLGFEVTAERLAHAYLFCGPRAIGKTTMARLLAKSVNCLKRKKGSADPCNACATCKEITEGSSLDVIEIDAASHTGVDNVRETIIASARLAPSHSKYKVFIIDEAHMLSTAAFNALLKIMEEPPAHVIFILCTTEAHKLPATIVSRCQRFDFKKIPYAEIIKKLGRIAAEEDIKIEAPVIEAIARHSGGHMRDAESLLGQVIALGGTASSLKGKLITLAEAELIIPRSLITEAVELLEFLLSRDASNAIAYINRLADDGADLKTLASEVVDVMRSAMLTKINPALGSNTTLQFGEGIESRLVEMLPKLEANELSLMIERMLLVGREIKDAPLPQLPFELAIVDLCFGAVSSSESSSMPPISRPPQPMRSAPAQSAQNAPKSEQNSSEPALTSAALMDAWQELLVRIRPQNHSLAFVLKSGQPVGMEGSNIKLAFKYKIHHDRMNDPAIRGLVEAQLREICARPVGLITILDPELVLVDNTKPEPYDPETARIAGAATEAAGIDSTVIDNLLKTFGGKIVS